VWLVFLTVASNLEAAPGSPQRQHDGGPLVVSCGQYVQKAANVCHDQVGDRMASGGCSDFHIRHMASVVSSGSCVVPAHVKCIDARALDKFKNTPYVSIGESQAQLWSQNG